MPYRPEETEVLASPEELARETTAPRPSFIAVQAPFATPEKLNKARELVRTLAVACTNSALYPMTHPLVTESLDGLAASIAALVATGFPSLTVNIYKGTLFIENQVFPEESVVHRKLVEELLDHGISAVTFLEGVRADDAAVLVELLGQAQIKTIGDTQDYLARAGVQTIKLAETSTLDERDSAEKTERGRETRIQARRNYDYGLEAMREIEQQAKLGRVGEVNALQHIVESLLENLLQDPAAVMGLTTIKSHDDYTLNHSLNVCIFALSLGSAIGVTEDELRSLGLAALLYDIGKVWVPEEILSKQGPLTSEEWQTVKQHSEDGAVLLKRLNIADKVPMIVAYEHHQRHDLLGYPEAVNDSKQHLFSRIVALCDAYDAMTTTRPFRREIRPDKALSVLMQGRGMAYDPDITRAFVEMLGIYPMGAVVMLDDGSTAVVFRVNSDDLLHPRVKILADPEGRWLESPEMADLRLVDVTTGKPLHSIIQVVQTSETGIDDVWQYL
ncbi:MAG: HD-GYP domain-containing protein [Coriobacteriia bacterium]|nr:HD-GYP domain-containing protein [Coriobacteriia bacterium]